MVYAWAVLHINLPMSISLYTSIPPTWDMQNTAYYSYQYPIVGAIVLLCNKLLITLYKSTYANRCVVYLSITFNRIVIVQLLLVQQLVLCIERPFLLEKKTEEIRNLSSLFLKSTINVY